MNLMFVLTTVTFAERAEGKTGTLAQHCHSLNHHSLIKEVVLLCEKT